MELEFIVCKIKNKNDSEGTTQQIKNNCSYKFQVSINKFAFIEER